MIPKVIHYCWFGGNPLTELAEKCIKSWKKFCPDYEIIRWDESNFDISQNKYCAEAYESKKWAFVSDYARLKILYEYGGIYMDTDVEVLKNLDAFLNHPAFSGFENESQIPTGIMASEKFGKWVNCLLSYYDNRSFILPDGNFDLTTNVISITDTTMKHYPLTLNNTFQNIDGIFTLYPKDFFCPKNNVTGKLEITENTHAIHHFNGSWTTSANRRNTIIYQRLTRYLGKNTAERVKKFKKKVWSLFK